MGVLYNSITIGQVISVELEQNVFQSDTDIIRLTPESRGCLFEHEVRFLCLVYFYRIILEITFCRAIRIGLESIIAKRVLTNAKLIIFCEYVIVSLSITQQLVRLNNFF